jgi:hypothetical protein
MGPLEVEAFLTHLAVEGKVASSTQNQALNAIVFLYKEVIKQPVVSTNSGDTILNYAFCFGFHYLRDCHRFGSRFA